MGSYFFKVFIKRFAGFLFFFALLNIGKIRILELNLLFLWYMAG